MRIWAAADESAEDFRNARAEAEFVAVADEAEDSWPWWRYVGGPSAMTENLNALREILRGYVRYRWR